MCVPVRVRGSVKLRTHQPHGADAASSEITMHAKPHIESAGAQKHARTHTIPQHVQPKTKLRICSCVYPKPYTLNPKP